jgi:dTDP-4-dehydrorhamnose reductase
MPEDTSAPNTEYGRQKAELEEILVGELARTAVVRLTKVVHPAFPLFRDWLAALTRGEAIRPFSDLPFCPVDLALVTEELGALGQSFRPGVFQLSGDADLSYAEAARLLAETRGFSLALVQPRTTEEAGLTSPFPLHTALAHRPVREGGKAESAADTLRRIFRAL